MSEERVCISLERYNKFLKNEEMVHKLDKKLIFAERELEQIIGDRNFNMNIGRDKKIYELYERIILDE